MKGKGFTLIELLAVIVILAIIALIAVPIIINIINSARESVKERSRELYGKAVENAVLKYQLDGTVLPVGDYALDTSTGQVCHTEQPDKCVTPEVEGEKPVVYTMEIENGKITSQTIKLKTNDPTYTKEGNGKWTKGETSTHDYYYWGTGSISGGLPTTNIDRYVSNITIPNNRPFYLAFDSADGETIDAAYVCFVVTQDNNPKEYCIQGGVAEELRAEVFTSNQGILDTAFPSACSLDGGDYYCHADGLYANAFSSSNVYAGDGPTYCRVNYDGGFVCTGY